MSKRRKIFGILSVIIGFLMFGYGTIVLIAGYMQRISLIGMIAEAVVEEYREAMVRAQIIGFFATGIGLVLLIVGIVLLVKKSAAQLKKEMEFTALRQTPPAITLNASEIVLQLEKLGKLREQGILNEAEFQEQKKKILL